MSTGWTTRNLRWERIVDGVDAVVGGVDAMVVVHGGKRK
jgi:hypothetical protein